MATNVGYRAVEVVDDGAGIRFPMAVMYPTLATAKPERLGPLCSASYMPHIVLNGVSNRTRIDYRLIPNAGHFSFLSPWPAAMTSPALPLSQDRPGFARRQFRVELEREVMAFLQREM